MLCIIGGCINQVSDMFQRSIVGIINTKHKTQNTEHKTQNTKRKTQNTKHKTQTTKTKHTKHKIQTQ